MFLPDVNVLIAVVDRKHPHHAAARDFMPRCHADGWATCPVTENGLLRIVGHVNYPDGPGSANAARALLEQLQSRPGHTFWPDDLTLTDRRWFPSLPVSRHLTDLYLLALAARRQARLATFDSRIDPSLIPGGPQAYHVIKG